MRHADYVSESGTPVDASWRTRMNEWYHMYETATTQHVCVCVCVLVCVCVHVCVSVCVRVSSAQAKTSWNTPLHTSLFLSPSARYLVRNHQGDTLHIAM